MWYLFLCKKVLDMIQNTNDIYKLIKSPSYTVAPDSSYKFYTAYNKQFPNDCVHIHFFDTYMEIYKYKNMNSEYYENIVTTNKRGNEIAKQFKKTLMAKRAVARIKMVLEKQK